MKIVFVYASPFPRKEGHTAADRRVRDLARGLRGAGAEVVLAIPKFHKGKCAANNESDVVIKYLGLDVADRYFFIGRATFWLSLLCYMFRTKRDAAFFYNTRIDSVLPALIMRLMGRHVAWEVCDLHRYLKSGSGLFAIISYISETLMAYIASSIFVISSDLRENILGIRKNANVYIVPVLVDVDVFGAERTESGFRKKFDVAADEILISYVGGMWKHQGVKDLISAFDLLAAKAGNVTLVIAGKYVKSKIHDDVVTLVKESGLESRVILPGWVDTEGVLQILDSSDVLVLPQKNDPFTSAGMPTKVAEYCVVGKAIVATDVGDLSLYLRNEENCLLCDADNPESLAAALLRLSSDASLRARLSENARSLAFDCFDYRANGRFILSKLMDGWH